MDKKSWEDIIEEIKKKCECGRDLERFYEKCKEFNERISSKWQNYVFV